ncbi:MAG: hypothetical protein FRX48_09032 [Lasallia pustulata]|uniref:Uncharacterized protein n=1 Tax=Lasallia pustulata TaxID=136370 RepID=A0A5M8PEC2_9LECA|nr:MAG: hypothetical protein FRX48_09032 [Lasallia pustulata]
MSTLAKLYNSLQDVYDVNQQVESCPEAIEELAKLLFHHNLQQAYDIRLAHNHFNIDEGEAVVAFDGDGFNLSTQYGIKPQPDGVLAATDFVISDDGEAMPYEFAYGRDINPPRLEKNFLAAWSSILRSKGLSGSLGLAVQEGSATGGHEMSDGDIRVNKLTFGGQAPNDQDYATTSWRVIDDGDGTFITMKCLYCANTRQRHKCG